MSCAVAESCLPISVPIHAYRTALREASLLALWASPMWWNHQSWPYMSQGHCKAHVTYGPEPLCACEGQGYAHGKGNCNIWGPAGAQQAACFL